jgi:tungstate transport system substrate-binding protein
MRAQRFALSLIIVVVAGASAIGEVASSPPSAAAPQPVVLRLATTTSTADTGLLAAILPEFEKSCGCRVDVVAVGTGQALELGRRGDADVLLVHAPDQEAVFMKEGHGARRDDVMYNDFVIVGPAADPAGVKGVTVAKDAFRRIASARASFASRGDRSGTHSKELALWKAAGQSPTPTTALPWYLSLGQGMGETLGFANERQAYTLSDRGTWLSAQGKMPGLRLLFGGASIAENPDRDLRNQYGVIVVSQQKHATVNAALAGRFADWLLSKTTQQRIGAFGRDTAGQSLFYPDSDAFKSTDSIRVTIGTASKTFSLADLRGMPKATLSGVEYIGVKKGKLGTFTWTGVSLKALLVAVDPGLSAPGRSGSTIEVVSSDGWVATLAWNELFGRVTRGEGLYRAKGCNECHGLYAEGTSPAGKRPAPPLANRPFDESATVAMIHAGTQQHAGISAYTPDRISDTDLRAILAWFANPKADAVTTFIVPPARQVAVLAFDRDGRPMGGREGLIQLVVGPDEFASRYSHWVSEIRVR